MGGMPRKLELGPAERSENRTKKKLNQGESNGSTLLRVLQHASRPQRGARTTAADVRGKYFDIIVAQKGHTTCGKSLGSSLVDVEAIHSTCVFPRLVSLDKRALGLALRFGNLLRLRELSVAGNRQVELILEVFSMFSC